MKKKIRILYVLNDLLNGGTEAYVMNQFRELDQNKFHADFLVFSGRNIYYKDEICSYGGHVFVLSDNNNREFFTNIKK